ncbi:hypothetical protein FCS83_03675 [Oenococcus sp. UCMA 17063]|nr:hypothetical protein [Oenococcus sp. UCMA 17063]
MAKNKNDFGDFKKWINKNILIVKSHFENNKSLRDSENKLKNWNSKNIPDVFLKRFNRIFSTKKAKRIGISISILFFFLFLFSFMGSGSSKQSSQMADSVKSVKSIEKNKQKVSKAKNNKSVSSKKHKKYDFKKLSLGMTKDYVIKLLGKPTRETGNSLYYGKQNLSFKNGKLVNGTPQYILELVSAQKASISVSEESSSSQAASISAAFSSAAFSQSVAASVAASSQAAAAAESARSSQILAASRYRASSQAAATVAANQNNGEQVYEDANGQGTILGVINEERGTKIYHLPGDPYYNRIKNVAARFKTVQEAIDAGYRASER